MIPPTPSLSTHRLVLRPLDPQNPIDTALIVRTYNDPFIGAWGFSKVGVRTHEDVVKKHSQHGPRNRPEMCTTWIREYGEVADLIFHLIYLKNDAGEAGEYIGFVGISFRTEVNIGPDFGYAIFEQFCRKGYASEAGVAAMKWWRDDVGVKTMWLGTFDGNVASQKCARRIGFVEGGEIKIMFGDDEKSVAKGRGFVMPGMEWPAGGLEIRPTVAK